MKKLKNYLRLATVACALCFAMTGCGTDKNASTSGNNNGDDAVDKVADDIGNAADDIGNAADDAADGIGNAVDDLVGNGGFNNYSDAHDYFLDTMGSYHSDAKFELRDEDENLNDYQEGSKGYRFNLYDTSKDDAGEMFGEFYVDATSGTIYKKGENNSFEEYPANGTGSGANNTTNKGTNISSRNTTKNTGR